MHSAAGGTSIMAQHPKPPHQICFFLALRELRESLHEGRLGFQCNGGGFLVFSSERYGHVCLFCDFGGVFLNKEVFPRVASCFHLCPPHLLFFKTTGCFVRWFVPCLAARPQFFHPPAEVPLNVLKVWLTDKFGLLLQFPTFHRVRKPAPPFGIFWFFNLKSWRWSSLRPGGQVNWGMRAEVRKFGRFRVKGVPGGIEVEGRGGGLLGEIFFLWRRGLTKSGDEKTTSKT